MMSPVSVVIPVHNRAHTIKACVNSVLSQTHTRFEIILVDDHSSDGSVQLMHELVAADPRVSVIEQADDKHGAQAARNAGIYAANYEWIMFNDSDDIWVSDKMQKEISVLEKYGFDAHIVIYSDCNAVNIKTGEKKLWQLPHISEENSYADLLVQSGPMFQSLLCSKIHLEEIGFLDEDVPSYQEWDTSIRLAKNGRFVHIREPLFDYYVGADDAISKSIEMDFIGRCNIHNKFKDEIIGMHGEKKYRRMLAENLFQARGRVDFERLKIENSVVDFYEKNLISMFGKNYLQKVVSLMQSDFSMGVLGCMKWIVKKI